MVTEVVGQRAEGRDGQERERTNNQNQTGQWLWWERVRAEKNQGEDHPGVLGKSSGEVPCNRRVERRDKPSVCVPRDIHNADGHGMGPAANRVKWMVA